MSGPEFEGVLAAHEYALQMRGGGICICGHVPTVDSSTLQTQQDYHRAHLSAALHAELARWLGDEGTREVVAEVIDDAHWCESNYTRGCNCHEWRTTQATAALAALTTTDQEDHR